MDITTKSVTSPKGEVTLYTIRNASGASVTLGNIGAGIVSVNVPDASGKMADVAMGYADPLDYFYDGPCSGKIPGRYAGRIGQGRFSIDGVEYSLAINNGPNALHGGPEGFQNRIWDAKLLEDGVEFSRVSPDGEEHYPGTLTVTATYRWSEDNVLTLNMRATTDARTVLNLTNHAYFNLGGHNSGTALDHILKLEADTYVPTDETLVPFGRIDPVAGTPLDFVDAHPVRRDFFADFPALKNGKGIDNSWVIRDYVPGKIQLAATMTDPVSGRKLEISTDQPIVHVYAGCWIGDAPQGKDGYKYNDYDAISIECQDFPDAPNHPEFPSTVLSPEEEYNRTIQFKFSVK